MEISLSVKSKDISKGGIRLVASNDLIKGSNVKIKCSLASVPEESTLYGDVVWTHQSLDQPKMFEVGIKFTSIGERAKHFLDEQITKLEEFTHSSETPPAA